MRSLTDKQIDEIRELFNSGLYTKSELANMYDVSPTTIALWLPEISAYREMKIRAIYKREHKWCNICNKYYNEHEKCKWCEIIIHNKPCICDEENH